MTRLHAGQVLGAAATLVLPVGLLAHKGLAPLFVAVAVVLLALEVTRRRSFPPVPAVVSVLLAGLTALAAASALWSMTPSETLKTVVSLGATFLGGVVIAGAAGGLRDDERRAVESGLIAGGAVGFAFLAVDLASHGAVTRFLHGVVGKTTGVPSDFTLLLNPGATVAALYLWPLGLALRRRYSRVAAVAGWVAAAVILVFAQATAPILALAAGGVVFLGALAWPRLVPAILAAAVAAGVMTAPWTGAMLPNPATAGDELAVLPNSALHRLHIWRTTAAHIKKQPVLGYGFDTSRAFYNEKARIEVKFAVGSPGGPWSVIVEPIPLHPHNGVLQVWLELGGIGALLLLAVLLALVRAAAGLSRRVDQAAGLGLFTGGLAVASVSYGAWQSWWLAALMLVAGLMVAATGGRDAG